MTWYLVASLAAGQVAVSAPSLYARWLYRRIVRMGWHPCLRINTGGTFHAEGRARRCPLKHLVPKPGTQWAGRGVAFTGRGRRLECTLLACWEPGYKDPWLLVTDLAPEASEAAWYGLRAWIEQSFKVAKRGGWQWQRTRMNDAQRATRLWLMLALATLWLLSVGGEAEATIAESTLPEVDGWRSPRRRSTRGRSVSVFRRGWHLILAVWWRQAALPVRVTVTDAGVAGGGGGGGLRQWDGRQKNQGGEQRGKLPSQARMVKAYPFCSPCHGVSPLCRNQDA